MAAHDFANRNRVGWPACGSSGDICYLAEVGRAENARCNDGQRA